MPAPKRKTTAQLDRQCENWNDKDPTGTPVSYEEIIGDGETYRGKSNGDAYVMGGHTAVIFLEGKAGCVDLDHCKAVA